MSSNRFSPSAFGRSTSFTTSAFPQDAQRWRKWCDERGLYLLEDAAQAWLATSDGVPLGSLGDLSIFCVYKTVGVPDGGALLCRVPAAKGEGSPTLQSGPLLSRHAAWLAGRSSVLARLSRLRKVDAYDVNARLRAWGSRQSAVHAPSSSSSDGWSTPGRRDGDGPTTSCCFASSRDSVTAPFDHVPQGASPFAFPLSTERKTELLERLRRKGIAALDFWSVPHPALPTERFPRATELRERVLALPVHQELDLSDVERIPRTVLGQVSRKDGLRLEPIESLDSVREEWSAIAAESGNIFATWEWTSIWWRHFGRDQRAPNPRLLLGRRPAVRVPAALPLHSAPHSADGSLPRASRSRSAGPDLQGGRPSPCRAGAPRGTWQAAARPVRRRVRPRRRGVVGFPGRKGASPRLAAPCFAFAVSPGRICSRVGARTSESRCGAESGSCGASTTFGFASATTLRG